MSSIAPITPRVADMAHLLLLIMMHLRVTRSMISGITLRWLLRHIDLNLDVPTTVSVMIGHSLLLLPLILILVSKLVIELVLLGLDCCLSVLMLHESSHTLLLIAQNLASLL